MAPRCLILTLLSTFRMSKHLLHSRKSMFHLTFSDFAKGAEGGLGKENEMQTAYEVAILLFCPFKKRCTVFLQQGADVMAIKKFEAFSLGKVFAFSGEFTTCDQNPFGYARLILNHSV